MQARWHSGHLHFPLACILDHSFEQRRLPSQCALHLNLRPAASCQVNILQTYMQAWRRKMGNFALSAAFELLRHSADWPLDRCPFGIVLSSINHQAGWRVAWKPGFCSNFRIKTKMEAVQHVPNGGQHWCSSGLWKLIEGAHVNHQWKISRSRCSP